MGNNFRNSLDSDDFERLLNLEFIDQEQIRQDERLARRLFAEDVDSYQGHSVETCPICLESINSSDLFIINACNHKFCCECIRKHLMFVVRDTKKYPIPCPSCEEPIDDKKCLTLLADSAGDHQEFQSYILEKKHIHNLQYCANPNCVSVFDWVNNPLMAGSVNEFKVVCPLCKTETCVKCKVIWHDGATCAEYSEQEEQRALRRLAGEKGWQKCPRCGELIEKPRRDCNFVRCNCGCGFLL